MRALANFLLVRALIGASRGPPHRSVSVTCPVATPDGSTTRRTCRRPAASGETSGGGSADAVVVEATGQRGREVAPVEAYPGHLDRADGAGRQRARRVCGVRDREVEADLVAGPVVGLAGPQGQAEAAVGGCRDGAYRPGRQPVRGNVAASRRVHLMVRTVGARRRVSARSVGDRSPP